MLAKLLILLGLIHICQSALDPKVKNVLDLTLPSYLHLPDLVFPNTTSCKGFWKSAGLACNQSLLTTYAKNDRDNLTKAEKDMNSTFEYMTSLAIQIRDQMGRLGSIADSASRNVNEYISSNKTEWFKEISSRCWNQMKTIRQNSLCSTCSGLNFNFYQGYKGGISINDCNRTIEVCSRVFAEVLSNSNPNAICWSTVLFSNIRSNINFVLPKMTVANVSTELYDLYVQYLKVDYAKTILFLPDPFNSLNKLKARICEVSLRINQPPLLHVLGLKLTN